MKMQGKRTLPIPAPLKSVVSYIFIPLINKTDKKDLAEAFLIYRL